MAETSELVRVYGLYGAWVFQQRIFFARLITLGGSVSVKFAVVYKCISLSVCLSLTLISHDHNELS